MKKTLSILCTIAMMVTAISMTFVGISVSAIDGASTTNCTENSDGTVSVGYNGAYGLSEFIRFSEGEEASITISVEEMGNAWDTEGFYIVVSPKVNAHPLLTIDTFAIAFNNPGAQYEKINGVIYRYDEKNTQSAADWATASLSGDITITIKQVDGKTILCLNEGQWSAGYTYIDGFTIPDGYLSVVTTAGCKLTVKNREYIGTNCTENADSSVSVGYNGSYALTDFARFSEGEEASITISVEEMGNAWDTEGFYIVVSPKVNAHPLLTIDTFAIAFNNPGAQYEKINGVIYRYDEKNTQSAADWATASLSGDITITIKQVDGKTILCLNEGQWSAGYTYIDGFTIPDGYLSVVTTAGCKLTVNPVTTEDTFTYGTAGILDTLVDGKQGLRFNYTLTTTAVGEGETVTVNGSTYTVSKIGMLVSKKADASMTVGASGVAQGYVTKARSIETQGEQITYTFSILVKNINKDNKATDIYARPYLECQDGTILYGKTQVTNVLEMYTSLSETKDFDTTVDDWMK